MRWTQALTAHSPAVTARVLAVPHAGGWPTAFLPWRAHMHPDVELRVVDLPGRGARVAEPDPASIAEIVAGVVRDLKGLPALPLAIVGHSFGAVVGYEVARALEASGRPPVRVVVSARQPPCFPGVVPVPFGVSDEEFADRLVAMGGLDSRLRAKLPAAREFLRAVRADLELLAEYRRPLTAAAFPITAVLGRMDPVVAADRMPLWSLETTGPFDLRRYDGTHFFLYDTAVAAELADRLARELLLLAGRALAAPA